LKHPVDLMLLRWPWPASKGSYQYGSLPLIFILTAVLLSYLADKVSAVFCFRADWPAESGADYGLPSSTSGGAACDDRVRDVVRRQNDNYQQSDGNRTTQQSTWSPAECADMLADRQSVGVRARQTEHGDGRLGSGYSSASKYSFTSHHHHVVIIGIIFIIVSV